MRRAPPANGVPPLFDLLLLGAGHAHVQVLKSFGMRPQPGMRLTVVTSEPRSPYSGMLPGFVRGCYGWDDLHIDVARLANFAGARFVAGAATGLDLAANRVLFAERPPLRFDALSINTGGVPGGRFASDFVTPVKPIGRFLPAWTQRLAEGSLEHLTVVGAGAGGVELALAIAARHPRLRVALVDGAPRPLPGFPPAVRRRALAALEARAVRVLTGFVVERAERGRVCAADQRAVATDHVLWTTGVEAPGWLAAAGLATDAGGFVRVDETLRSTSHAAVFAAGDVASMVLEGRPPLPKAGVYAVRQGPVLAANLRALATGVRRRAYRPQRRALAILGLGDGWAVACRGRWHVSGRWVWRWKQHLDKQFMDRFTNLPVMADAAPSAPAALAGRLPDPMRCGGCGAKLGADLLRRVLRQLDVHTSAATLRGIGDDAALVRLPGRELAVSCDGFRAMIDDVYRFGRIAAHHALNDLFAMGAEPAFALALATVPAMADALMEEDLHQLMSGALAVFGDHDVDLVGGHSAEGAELGLAFSVAGRLRDGALTKAGLAPGQRLVLTKALGTGALLAGAMRGRTCAEDLLGAVAAMDTSNAAAARILRAHGATGCTDVTGFGLAGHLAEMTRASGVGARVEVSAVPRLSGACEMVAAGVVSALQANNEQALTDFGTRAGEGAAPAVRLLADPQTAGGLLAGVPAEQAERCVSSLAAAGYPAAAVVGEVLEKGLALSG